jgi:hypothetical protein
MNEPILVLAIKNPPNKTQKNRKKRIFTKKNNTTPKNTGLFYRGFATPYFGGIQVGRFVFIIWIQNPTVSVI